MKFAAQHMLHLIWLIVAVGIFLFYRLAFKNKLRQQFIAAQLWPQILPEFARQREKGKAALMILVFVFAVFALLRPQWGFDWQEIKREGVNILVAMDTSRSMLTQDVKPNRLERSKLAIRDLLKKLRGDRIGLIAFAGGSFMVCPLTTDYNGFLLTLEQVDTDTIPQGGTSISQAIEEALRSYKDIAGKHKALVIITDGEDLQGNVLELAKKARQDHIKIFCVGIGTKEGELVRVKNLSGQSEFLKDKDGHFVKSRLNEKILQDIALTTGGAYVRSSGAEFGLDVIYDQYLSKFEKAEFKSKMEKRYHERFQYPLCLAFLLLCWETALTTRKTKKDAAL
jgi:Ca-activated chloride channel family protein